MSETFVEVGVEVVAEVSELFHEFARRFVNDKLFVKSGAACCFAVGFGEVSDGDALGAKVSANPVGVGEVDADSSGRIEVSGEDGSCDDFRADALHFFFFELGIHG